MALCALWLACGPPAPSEVELPAPGYAAEPVSVAFVAEDQQSHTRARLQAISAVGTEVLWASGLEGTFARTTDGGGVWQTAQMPGGAELQFRDVHAIDANTAYLLAAGPGALSRIYKTADGGATWKLQFLNTELDGFLDCFDFWSPVHGLAYGDSVRGELFVLTTTDGATWSRLPAGALPAASDGEGGFAASGGCVETGSEGRAWIATGAGGAGRVLYTEDYASTWDFSEAPTVRGTAAGLTAVLFRNDAVGLALGGDLERPDEYTANVAVTRDGGLTWAAGGRVTFSGAIYGGAWSPDGRTAIAAGPKGVSVTSDAGDTWTPLGDHDTWSVAFGDAHTFWGVGPGGRITRYSR